MHLIISLDGNNIKLTLKNGRKIVGEHAWVGEYTLSEQLLPQIDALLKKHKVKKEQVEKIIPKITQPAGVTSARIVQTIAKAWNLGQEMALCQNVWWFIIRNGKKASDILAM